MDPEINWEMTQAKLMIVRYAPLIPPTDESFEKSSIKISSEAKIRLLVTKYRMKAGSAIKFLPPKASRIREKRNRRLDARTARRLPKRVKIFGITSMPIMVITEAIA